MADQARETSASTSSAPGPGKIRGPVESFGIWEATMAVISMFYGIIVSMYFMDSRRHKLPHIHVKYQEHEAVLVIPDGALLEGSLPGSKMKLVQAWIEIHRDDLMADWDLASTGRGIFAIDPLK
jgi:hypothetical protein